MYLKVTPFDHDAEDLNRALCIEDETAVRCRERILFHCFTSYQRCIELYPDKDDAPRDMRTVTGDLKRILQDIDSEKEYEMTLLHFMAYHRLAMEAIAHYRFLNDNAVDEEDKLKLSILNLVKKLAKSRREEPEEDEGDNPLHKGLDMESLMDRIKKAKQSNYNFKRYMELTGFVTRDFSDVDELLRNIPKDDKE